MSDKIFCMSERFLCIIDQFLKRLKRIVQRIFVWRSFSRHITYNTLLFSRMQHFHTPLYLVSFLLYCMVEFIAQKCLFYAKIRSAQTVHNPKKSRGATGNVCSLVRKTMSRRRKYAVPRRYPYMITKRKSYGPTSAPIMIPKRISPPQTHVGSVSKTCNVGKS